jgi:hypothetical protein
MSSGFTISTRPGLVEFIGTAAALSRLRDALDEAIASGQPVTMAGDNPGDGAIVIRPQDEWSPR